MRAWILSATIPQVGNRTVMTDATGVTTYTYDAANRLTSVGGLSYTWDDRGNLVSDGTFTYTHNAAGRMVQVEGVTLTLVYTYNASGLRVAQSVDGDATTFVWDWVSGIPEMLSEGGNLYLVGHETLGQWDGGEWVYYLPDALGSIRQEADDTGDVTDSREWTPFGVEVGTAQAGLGYTGELWDGDAGLLYLRARWLDVGTGRFNSPDPIIPDFRKPQSIGRYLYALGNPVNFADPTGLCTMCGKGSTVTVYDPWSPDQGVALLSAPSLDAPVVGRVPNGSKVTIREDAPVLSSGIDWHSIDIPLQSIVPEAPDIGNIQVWLPNEYLIDDVEPGSYPDIPNPNGLRFATPPVPIGSVSSVQGFGATSFACNSCGGGDGQGECHDHPCDYRRVRGLHNGLDFSVPNGTYVYWTGNSNVPVVGKFSSDASPNVVVQVGTYYVVFGHLSERYVQPGRHFIYPGAPIGRTGHGHLHLGVRTATQFVNPLYFFESDLANRLIGMMGGYTAGEGPWSMQAYTYSAGKCMNYYWGCNPDRTGIDRP